MSIPSSITISGGTMGVVELGTRTTHISGGTNIRTGHHVNISYNKKEKQENKPDDAREVGYKMEEIPRGYCLIIGNNTFQTSEPRKGTEQDIEKLEATFKWLNFNVKIEKDRKADDIRKLMEEYSTMDHGKFDCFICCILSHGNSKGISGTDEENVTLNEIQEGLQKCKTLVGKPKVFFIQACRGRKEDKGIQFQTDDGSVAADSASEDPSSLVPVTADFAFGYATPPGYKAWRDTNVGSWFISSLCEVLQESAAQEHLIDMLTEVNRRLCEKVNQKGKKSSAKQCSHTETRLTKKLYFNPKKEFKENDSESESESE